jgi:hypothetical protein
VPHTVHAPLVKPLVGPAGEHYVLYRLYFQGMLASLAPPGTPTIDILVLDYSETVIATVQVKTRKAGARSGWVMGVKHETVTRPRCFYALVDLEPELPVVYIVPSAVVAEVVTKSHQAWLAAPGVKGQPHKDNPVRHLAGGEWLGDYRERWEQLLKPDSISYP